MKKQVTRISGILSIILFLELFISPSLGVLSSLDGSVQAQGEYLKVNFQTEASEIPEGYIPDYGEPYGTYNGYTYGWNKDHTDLVIDRNSNQDTRLDTLSQFHKDGAWEIELASGSYDVTVSVGDDVYGSTYTLNVEGENYWNNLVLNQGEFIQETKTVNVSDGKLTVDQGDLEEGKTRINYIEIVQINVEQITSADTTPPTTPQDLLAQNISHNDVTLQWDNATDNDAVKGYIIYRDDVQLSTVTDSVYYKDSGLSPLTTYKYEVAAFDHADNISPKSDPIQVTTTSVPSGSGIGLRGEYFNGTNFSDLKIRRLDEVIDFDLEAGAPDQSLDQDAFSVRWTGKLEPRFSEVYTFYTETHGGVRLWVDNQLLIDDWDTYSMTQQSGTISLTAGQTYDIKMEYREDQGAASAKLFWSSISQDKEIVPQSQLYPPFIPDIPSNINTTTTSTAVSLTWNEVDGATGYDVEVDGVTIDNGTNTTLVHSNLQPNTTHTYRVRSKVPEVSSEWSEAKTARTNLAVPANVEVTESADTITVTWEEVPGATSYEIEVDGMVIDNGTNTTYVHSGLTPNTEHTYRVRAKSDESISDWSQVVTKVLSSNIPTNINTIVTSTSVTVTWDEISWATTYDIEVDGVLIDNGASTAYTHDGLEPNTQHAYRVRAKSADRVGDWSVLLITSTLPEPGNGTGLKGEYFDNENLTDLKTSRIDESINFDWKRSVPTTDIEDHPFSIRWTGQVQPRFSETYTFYTEAHGGVRLWINNKLLIDDWEAHNMSEQSGTINLEAGKRYDIKMEYRETNGAAWARLYWESDSQPKEIIPQSQLYPIGIPKNLRSTSTETTITLTWDPVTFANGYEVEVDGEVIDNGSNNSFTHENLVPGTQHTYRVRAKNGIVIGEWSPSITEYTLLGKTTIQSMEATETSISVSWDLVYGATSYEIEVDGTIINNGNRTTFVHDGLLSGTEHSYRVRPKSTVVTGDWTTLHQKWTLPDIPQNIQTSSTSTTITLIWDDVRGATGYDVEVYNTTIDNNNETTFTEDSLNPNSQRTYRIRAKNSSGPGKWSSVIAETTLPGVPENLQTTATDTLITVSWDPAAGATLYDLEVDGIIMKDITDTEFIHSGLEPNSTHTYRVKAKNEKGSSSWSDPIEQITLPSVPQNVQTTVKSTEVIVMWDAVLGSTGYEIEIDGVVIDNGASTMYTHASVEPNTEHTYRVRAVNGEMKSFWSEIQTVLTSPGVPMNLKTTSTSSEITLTWDMVTGATGYDVEVDGVIVDNGLSTTYVHSDLLPNTEHQYRVRARNDEVVGEWSEYITEMTLFGTPANLQATATSTSITLTWDLVEGAAGYDVLVDGHIMDNGSETTFLHEGLEPNSFHVYRVRAKNSNVVGEWSEALTKATILATPANIRTEATSSQVTVTWDAVSGATGYEIEVDGVVIDNGTNTTYVHTNLTSNSEHSYRVRAYNGDVYSEWSEIVTQITTPGVPTIIDSEATPHSITVTWESVSGATSYDIEVDGQIITGITDTSYTHQELEPNTMHIYRVRAQNEGGTSEWSDKLEKVTTPVLNVKIGKDNHFNFVVVAPKKEGLNTRKLVVTYNPDEVEALDLNAGTAETNLSEGKIEGTNVTVTEFQPGKIVYKIENADKTVVNIVKFMSKTNEYTEITYTVE
jgi:chitodextrinase